MHTPLDYLKIQSPVPFRSYSHRLGDWYLSDHTETPPGFVPTWGADPACLSLSALTFRPVGSGNGLAQEAWYTPMRYPGSSGYERIWQGGASLDGRPSRRQVPLL